MFFGVPASPESVSEKMEGQEVTVQINLPVLFFFSFPFSLIVFEDVGFVLLLLMLTINCPVLRIAFCIVFAAFSSLPKRTQQAHSVAAAASVAVLLACLLAELGWALIDEQFSQRPIFFCRFHFSQSSKYANDDAAAAAAEHTS